MKTLGANRFFAPNRNFFRALEAVVVEAGEAVVAVVVAADPDRLLDLGPVRGLDPDLAEAEAAEAVGAVQEVPISGRPVISL